MSQITTGLRSVLSRPFMYDFLQWILGGDRARRMCCQDYLSLNPGDSIVDIGCGTATLLKHLPVDINYYGFDLSADYIAAAQRNFKTRGGAHFRCQDIAALTDGDLPPCRYAIAMGVLHHLDDKVAEKLIDNVYDRLAPGGKLIALDPVYIPSQSRIAYEIIRHDRGQNVRSPEGYLQLLSERYRNSVVDIRCDYFHIPYTLGIMTASRN